MSRRRLWLLTALTLFTLCFIWGNSLLPASVSGAFSTWVKELLEKLLPGFISEDSGDGLLRKLAHGTEYLILGVELWLLLRHCLAKSLSLPVLCGLTIAMIDETIQLFVPGRTGAVKDIWIDLGGFLVGCGVCLLVLYRRKKKE